MLWSDRLRRCLGGAALLGAAIALGGCFQPLHNAGGGTATSVPIAPAMAGSNARQLAAIDVLPMDGRIGQQIRNELIFFFTGGSAPAPYAYRLDVRAQALSAQTAIVDPFTDRPELETAGVDAVFTLTRVQDGAPLFSGKAFGRATYTRTRQRYASVRALRDAEDRASRTVSEQIRAQLQGYFARGG
jgi:LPS-assembly lipoprotein